MGDEAKQWWEKNAREFQATARLPIDVIYGPHISEAQLQLIGPVAGKHVLEVCCGGAQCGIAFAKQGAVVTGVDVAAAQLEYARELAAQHHVEITLYQRDAADLGPIAAGSQDIAFSSIAFHYVDDLLTCFKEIYRVLKPGGVFVWSIGHPYFAMIDPATLLPTRSYFDTGKVVLGREVSDEVGFAFAENRRTTSDYVNYVLDAGFRIERLVEPDIRPVDPADSQNWLWGQTPEALSLFPSTLIVKSRKS